MSVLPTHVEKVKKPRAAPRTTGKFWEGKSGQYVLAKDKSTGLPIAGLVYDWRSWKAKEPHCGFVASPRFVPVGMPMDKYMPYYNLEFIKVLPDQAAAEKIMTRKGRVLRMDE